MFLRIKASFLPPDPEPLSVSVRDEDGTLTGRFSLLAVTTLEKLLLSSELGGERGGRAQAAGGRGAADVAGPRASPRAWPASSAGRTSRGVHFEEADEITIEGDSSNVILDGETFRAERGSPINLKPAQPLSFVKLAA